MRESSREGAQERELKLVSSGEKAQKRENLRERTEKKLKRGRSEEPCPVGACLAAKS